MSRIQVNFNANIDWTRSNLVTIKDGSQLFTDLVREDIRAGISSMDNLIMQTLN